MNGGPASANASDRPLPLADTVELHEALEAADVPTLLMSYVHLTHDVEMLDRFKTYIRTPFSMPPTEIPPEAIADLKSALLRVLTVPGAAKDEAPSDDLMRRMMSVGVGEEVAEEFLPLLHDQIGLKLPPPRNEWTGRTSPPGDFKVLVIGAGMTGLCAGLKLREAGYDYITIEKNPDVGGTWYENRYPGVGVDTPSHFYSFSFEISPEWNKYHPHGADMQKYLLHVADKYDLRRDIRFNTRVVSLRFDDASALWHVTVRDEQGGEQVLTANAVINAHGPVNRWQYPNVPGLDTFEGALMHTATWDPSVELAGKRVAVIGTGASAAQLVPAIADEVGQLTVFMRSRHWVINTRDPVDLVSDGVKYALRHIPYYREWFRFRVYWFASDGLFDNVRLDPDYIENPLAASAGNEAMRVWAQAYLDQTFADRPDLLAKLTPDFPIFSKRIIIDGGWFGALKKDNVALETETISHILPNAIVMSDGRTLEFDVIVCATGFDVSNMLGSLEVFGRDGRSLRDEWGTDDPRAYLGVTVTGYPNYFLTVGPNSAPNHAAGQNLVSEVQVNYIIECLDRLVEQGARTMEPTRQAFDAWNAKIDERMTSMIWSHPRARSYYRNSKGRVYLSWPYRLVDYWTAMRGPELADYRIS